MDAAALQRAAQAFAQAAGAADWPAAEAALGTLLAADPSNPSLHYNLALVLRQAGRPAQALESVEAALGRDPAHQGAQFERAACLMELPGRLAEARAAFDGYLDRFPEDADGLLNRARVALRLGDPAAALADCDRAFAGGALAGDGSAGAAAHLPLNLARAEALRDLGRLDDMEALLATFEDPDLRPTLLKLKTQGPKGRLHLTPS